MVTYPVTDFHRKRWLIDGKSLAEQDTNCSISHTDFIGFSISRHKSHQISPETKLSTVLYLLSFPVFCLWWDIKNVVITHQWWHHSLRTYRKWPWSTVRPKGGFAGETLGKSWSKVCWLEVVKNDLFMSCFIGFCFLLLQVFEVLIEFGWLVFGQLMFEKAWWIDVPSQKQCCLTDVWWVFLFGKSTLGKVLGGLVQLGTCWSRKFPDGAGGKKLASWVGGSTNVLHMVILIEM